jgi:hypothetical protein
MSAWNPPASTGYPCTISWKIPAKSHWLTQSTSRLFAARRLNKKDARWIADLFKHDLVAASFMPSFRIRQLRDLMRYRFKLTNFASSEKNRIQNCLTVSNIQLANVVSDTFGKSSMKIIDYLLENPDDKDF